MKFIPKPIPIDAEQFHASDVQSVRGVNPPMRGDAEQRFYVVTAHGQQTFIESGDWIVAEPENRGFYPVKPDIFAASYEAVEEGPAR